MCYVFCHTLRSLVSHDDIALKLYNCYERGIICTTVCKKSSVILKSSYVLDLEI